MTAANNFGKEKVILKQSDTDSSALLATEAN